MCPTCDNIFGQPDHLPIEYNNQKGSGVLNCNNGGFSGIELHSAPLKKPQDRTAQFITINNVWSIDGQTYGIQVRQLRNWFGSESAYQQRDDNK